MSEPAELRAAVRRLLTAGAGAVLLTRGERSAWAFRGEEEWEVTPPRFSSAVTARAAGTPMFARWLRAGCAVTRGGAVGTGAAAGAAAFLRHGLGSVTRDVVEELRAAVRVERRA